MENAVLRESELEFSQRIPYLFGINRTHVRIRNSVSGTPVPRQFLNETYVHTLFQQTGRGRTPQAVFPYAPNRVRPTISPFTESGRSSK